MTAAPLARPDRSRIRAGTGLVIFGIVGVVLLSGVLAALLFSAVSAQGMLDTLDTTRDEVLVALDEIDAALRTSEETLTGVSTSLEETGASLVQAGVLASILAPGTSGLADQAGSFGILGQLPFEGMAEPLRDVSTSLDELSARLDAAGSSISTNGPTVAALGSRLGGVSDSLAANRDRLAGFELSIGLTASLGLIALVLLVIWLMVPAFAAIWIGYHWRRAEPSA